MEMHSIEELSGIMHWEAKGYLEANSKSTALGIVTFSLLWIDEFYKKGLSGHKLIVHEKLMDSMANECQENFMRNVYLLCCNYGI